MRKKENDKMYEHLNKIDVDNKWKREQAYDSMRAEAIKQELEELDRQIQYKKEKAADLSQIHARELAINAQIQKEIEDEKRKREEEKNSRFIRAQEHTTDMMTTRDYYRDMRIKREEIVAREFLKKAVREMYIERADRNKAKREMMRSIQIYLEYLRRNDEFSKTHKGELQRIIDAVIEEQYIKVNATRRREHLQRKQLFSAVVAGREQQIQDLQDQKQKEEIKHEQELQYLKDEWKTYLAEVEYGNKVRTEKKQKYLRDLDGQMQYQDTIKQRQNTKGRREKQLCTMEEGFFHNRLDATLKQAQLQASNPYRQPLVGKKIHQYFVPVGSCQK